MTVSVITPVKDCPQFIAAYKEAIEGADEVIIVDTGSAPDNRAAWSECGRVIDYGTPGHNYGHWCNAGYGHSTGDVIIFLNNDVEADGPWLPERLEDGALYGPELAYQHVAGVNVPFLSGWCIAATRETWERLKTVGRDTRNPGEPGVAYEMAFLDGPWDTCSYPAAGYWEDNDLSFRALLADLSLRRTYWPLCHINNGTSKDTAGAFADVQRNRATFARSVWAAIGGAHHA